MNSSNRESLPRRPKLPGPDWTKPFARRLLAWFRGNQRDLPWRRTRDPYRVWVSEIMLQQTQVATVIPYYQRFLSAFPTLQALAQAAETDVLRQWEGLGYYRRARQMHAAARQIVAEHDGQFPRELERLVRLPGIGRYTAGAIASLAFDAPAPILEANTVRLYSRLLAYRGDPASAAGRKLLWQLAERLLPERDVGPFNQALMELGSLVCAPTAPNCDRCPASELCSTNRLGLQARIPRQRIKPATVAVREAAVVVRRRGRVLVRQCQPGERWVGLWDFPRFALSDEEVLGQLVAGVRRLTGQVCSPGERMVTIKHSVTRFRITLDCYRAEHVRTDGEAVQCTALRWLRVDQLDDVPLSTTGRKLARLLGRTVGRGPSWHSDTHARRV